MVTQASKQSDYILFADPTQTDQSWWKLIHNQTFELVSSQCMLQKCACLLKYVLTLQHT